MQKWQLSRQPFRVKTSAWRMETGPRREKASLLLVTRRAVEPIVSKAEIMPLSQCGNQTYGERSREPTGCEPPFGGFRVRPESRQDQGTISCCGILLDFHNKLMFLFSRLKRLMMTKRRGTERSSTTRMTIFMLFILFIRRCSLRT